VQIILLRHAQSLGNVDELAYTRIPDHALPLTTLGEQQARATGPVVRALLDGERAAAYVSPYVRAVRTVFNYWLAGVAPVNHSSSAT
jgi:broad specificity phosphatase PhoE